MADILQQYMRPAGETDAEKQHGEHQQAPSHQQQQKLPSGVVLGPDGKP